MRGRQFQTTIIFARFDTSYQMFLTRMLTIFPLIILFIHFCSHYIYASELFHLNVRDEGAGAAVETVRHIKQQGATVVSIYICVVHMILFRSISIVLHKSSFIIAHINLQCASIFNLKRAAVNALHRTANNKIFRFFQCQYIAISCTH